MLREELPVLVTEKVCVLLREAVRESLRVRNCCRDAELLAGLRRLVPVLVTVLVISSSSSPVLGAGLVAGRLRPATLFWFLDLSLD